jgi:hypothetical protein
MRSDLLSLYTFKREDAVNIWPSVHLIQTPKQMQTTFAVKLTPVLNDTNIRQEKFCIQTRARAGFERFSQITFLPQ